MYFDAPIFSILDEKRFLVFDFMYGLSRLFHLFSAEPMK